jgi:hypothetical protein
LKQAQQLALFTSAGMSFGEITDAVRAALKSTSGSDWPYIKEVYPDYVIWGSDYDAVLLSKTPYTVGEDGLVAFGDSVAVTEKRIFETVTMSTFSISTAGSTREEDGDFYVYKGVKVFEAGAYPDKNIEVTDENLKSMVASFKPVKGDLEHIFARTPADQQGNLAALRGMFGELRTIWPDPSNPKVLRGDVTVPKWLDPKLPGKGISVEIPVDEPGVLVGYTLTTSPRVQDAALMSELTSHLSPEPNSVQATQTKETPEMDENSKKEDGKTTPPVTPTTPTPDLAAFTVLQQQNAALMSQMEEVQRQNRETAADAAYSKVLNKKVTPAQREWFMVNRVQAATDDAGGSKPVVTFSDSAGNTQTPPSRVAMFDAFVESLPDVAVSTGEAWKDQHLHVIGGSTPLANFNTAGQEQQQQYEEEAKALREQRLAEAEARQKSAASYGYQNGR